jgi:hypothetical protein
MNLCIFKEKSRNKKIITLKDINVLDNLVLPFLFLFLFFLTAWRLHTDINQQQK